MTEKLSLESPRWQTLQSFGGISEDLPKLIEQAQAECALGKNQAFRNLQDRIYHQYSCCEATFAVLPYLVEIGAEVPYEKCRDIWVLVGHIAVTCDAYAELSPVDLLPVFRSALSDAEPRCIESFLANPLELYETYYLSVAAIGMAGHPLGKLFMDNPFAHKEAESTAICPYCGMRIQVACFDSGLVVGYDPVLYPNPPESSQMPERPGAFEIPKRSPNPWAPVGRELRALIQKGGDLPGARSYLEVAALLAEGGLTPDVDIKIVFSLLGALITLKGYPKPAMRYFHTHDKISCPSCKSNFVFADHWWGLEN